MAGLIAYKPRICPEENMGNAVKAEPIRCLSEYSVNLRTSPQMGMLGTPIQMIARS